MAMNTMGYEKLERKKYSKVSQPPVFNEHMILQRHHFSMKPYEDIDSENKELHLSSSSTSSSSLSQQQSSSRTNHIRSHPDSRNLFLFGTATGSICSLSGDIFYFNQDPVTQLYYWNGDKNDAIYSEIDSIWNSTVLDRWNVADHIKARQNITNTTTEMNITSVAVRACLCTQYVNRPVEFCSAEFLSCSIRDVPIQCFTLSSTDTFIQSFWPVTIFWMLVVIYVWSCSDPGRIARQYYQRKFRCTACCRIRRPLPNTNTNTNNDVTAPTIDEEPQRTDVVPLTDEQMVQQQLDSIIENYPSRANYMYREAINRKNRQERYESVRQSFLWYRTYQRIKRSFIHFICCHKSTSTNDMTTTTTTNTINEETNAVEMMTSETPPPELLGPRLLLKTKVFYFDDVTARANTDTNRIYSLQEQAIDSENTLHHAQSNVTIRNETNQIINDEHDSSDRNDEIRCAICLLPLQDGIDMIGNLPCHHCMHKHCLKEWLMRKNRCPLCQLSDVAVYQNPTYPTNNN